MDKPVYTIRLTVQQPAILSSTESRPIEDIPRTDLALILIGILMERLDEMVREESRYFSVAASIQTYPEGVCVWQADSEITFDEERNRWVWELTHGKPEGRTFTETGFHQTADVAV